MYDAFTVCLSNMYIKNKLLKKINKGANNNKMKKKENKINRSKIAYIFFQE